ncbi:MAG: GspE/PulE family protein [Candidatus Geothermincolia bacterium]
MGKTGDEGFIQSLLSDGLITQDQFVSAREIADRQGTRITDVIARRGYLREESLLDSLSAYLDVPRVTINPEAIRPEAAELIGSEDAVEYHVLPVSVENNVLTLAISAPLDVETGEKFSFRTGCSLDYVVCSDEEIRAAINTLYQVAVPIDEFEEVDEKLLEYIDGNRSDPPEGVEVNEADIVKLVDGLLASAIRIGASDIHIEPKMDNALVRIRIDGILSDFKVLPGEQHHAVLSRIKILSNLDIAEKRRPQDGVIFVKYGNTDVDFRVATSPTIYGEGVVLRVLDQGRAAIKLTGLGFSEADLATTMHALNEPYGFVLSTGPTGTGKTTTMYAMLNKLNRTERMIVTIEDPVEYRMANINQIPINHLIDLGFAPLLRSVLRQDPNIILVGEIRDGETAHVAVQAALTGHLLLSTLHTTDAPEVLLRLMEIGIEHYYVREVVKLIVAQRLVRQLCPNCVVDYSPTAQDLVELGLPPDAEVKLKAAGSCDECRNTGYQGRTGVFEVMPMSPEIKDMMAPDVRLSKIKELAVQQGMRTLWQNAVDKVLAGETSIDEIKRAVPQV